MNLALIGVLLAGVNLIFTLLLLLGFKRATVTYAKLAQELTNQAPELVQEALTAVAPELQKSIAEGLGEGLKSVAGSVLARNSAVSRQMKSLEKEVLADGIEKATGLSGIGPIAAKYVQKYPFLMGFLQKIQQNQGKGGSSGISGNRYKGGM